MLSGAGRLPRRRIIPRVAVVGLGYWGPNLVRVMFERTDVEVRWICDRDPSRLERLSRRYPSMRTTQNLDEILDDPLVDGVVLATPVHTHYALAMRCMQAGKHTFVEKPLAPSTDAGDRADRLRHARRSSCSCAATRSCSARRCARSRS